MTDLERFNDIIKNYLTKEDAEFLVAHLKEDAAREYEIRLQLGDFDTIGQLKQRTEAELARLRKEKGILRRKLQERNNELEKP